MSSGRIRQFEIIIARPARQLIYAPSSARPFAACISTKSFQSSLSLLLLLLLSLSNSSSAQHLQVGSDELASTDNDIEAGSLRGADCEHDQEEEEEGEDYEEEEEEEEQNSHELEAVGQEQEKERSGDDSDDGQPKQQQRRQRRRRRRRPGEGMRIKRFSSALCLNDKAPDQQAPISAHLRQRHRLPAQSKEPQRAQHQRRTSEEKQRPPPPQRVDCNQQRQHSNNNNNCKAAAARQLECAPPARNQLLLCPDEAVVALARQRRPSLTNQASVNVDQQGEFGAPLISHSWAPLRPGKLTAFVSTRPARNQLSSRPSSATNWNEPEQFSKTARQT